MKYNILKNEDRGTVTLVISPVMIPFTKYLYEKYDGKRYFASGVVEGNFKKDIQPLAKELAQALNEVAGKRLPKNEKINVADIVQMEENVFRLISQHTDKNDEWDGRFQFNLGSKKNKGGFLFSGFSDPQPIPEDTSTDYTYAIELELAPGYNEDKLEKYVFTIFHRGFAVGERESSFKSRDDAWGGFDFDDAPAPAPKTQENQDQDASETKNTEEPDLDEIDISEDDLPF